MIGTFFSLAIPSLFIIIGIVFLRTPTRSLLKWDRQTGYWIYKSHLRLTGNEEEALGRAGHFYRIFAMAIIIFSTIFMVISIVTALQNDRSAKLPPVSEANAPNHAYQFAAESGGRTLASSRLCWRRYALPLME